MNGRRGIAGPRGRSRLLSSQPLGRPAKVIVSEGKVFILGGLRQLFPVHPTEEVGTELTFNLADQKNLARVREGL